MILNMSYMLFTVGIISACQPNSSRKDKYTATITGFELPTQFAYFQKYTLGSDVHIKNTAGSIAVARRNFWDVAEKALNDALKEVTGYNFGKQDYNLEITQDVLTCEGIAAESVAQINNPADLTNPIGCGVEKGVVVGTCTVLADCKDRTKWKAVDSKYTRIQLQTTPIDKNSPKWRRVAQIQQSVQTAISSKIAQYLKGAKVDFS